MCLSRYWKFSFFNCIWISVSAISAQTKIHFRASFQSKRVHSVKLLCLKSVSVHCTLWSLISKEKHQLRSRTKKRSWRKKMFIEWDHQLLFNTRAGDFLLHSWIADSFWFLAFFCFSLRGEKTHSGFWHDSDEPFHHSAAYTQCYLLISSNQIGEPPITDVELLLIDAELHILGLTGTKTSIGLTSGAWSWAYALKHFCCLQCN